MPSYCYFTPATDVAAVNAKAEENGYGPDSLSIPLIDIVTNAPWFGTHSFVDLLQPTPELWSDDSLPVVTEYYEDGDPLANWQDALEQNGLAQ